MAVAQDRLERLKGLLTEAGEEFWVIGEVVEGDKITVEA
jgi:phosphoribosylaminoimidazole (AIR) synthetase